MCVVCTWLFDTTGASVLLAVVLRAATHVASAYLAPAVAPQLTFSLLWVAVAAGIVLRY